MDWIRVLLSRVVSLFRRKELDARLDEELGVHVDLAIAENLRRGMTAEEARTAVLREFGGVTQTRERYRVQQGLPWLEICMQDFRYALRRLRKSPGFTLTAVLALALGIGPNVAIFSIVWATFFQPLPYPNPDQLVVVWVHNKGERVATPAQAFAQFAAQNQSFQRMDFVGWNALHLTSADHTPEEFTGSEVTPGFYSRLLGVKTVLGRDFLDSEGDPGTDHVTLLNHRLWMERFNSDPNIVGKTIQINDQPYTVVGVLQAVPNDRQGGHFLVPVHAYPGTQLNDSGNVFGRLKSNVTIAQAQAEAATLLARELASTAMSSEERANWTISVESMHNDWLDKKVQRNLWMLLAAVGLVLLIACANIASLLLARGAARGQELAVRAALGATRRRIFAQLLMESLLLALLGGAAGIALGWGIMKASMTIFPDLVNQSAEAVVEMNLPVLGFAVLISLLAGAIFGCAPGWKAGRTNAIDALRVRGVMGDRSPVLSFLVVAEVALAMILLSGAGMTMHSFWKLTQIDLGFSPERLVSGWLHVPIRRTSDGKDVIAPAEEVLAQQHQLLERLRALPGVTDAALTIGVPLNGYNRFPFHIAGEPSDKEHEQSAITRFVSPEYFRTLGIRLVQGRFFSAGDRLGAPLVAVVNESFVHRFLGGRDPLTQRIDMPRAGIQNQLAGATQVDYQIVGVFHDTLNGNSVTSDTAPEMIIALDQMGWPFIGIAVRTAGDPAAVTPMLRRTVAAAIPGAVIDYVHVTEQQIEEQRSTDRFEMVLFGAFAGIALLLSAVGIYGVMAFVVSQRSHEIGVRMALGAERGDVVRLMLRKGLRLAILGAVIGVSGAWLLGQAMRSTLYGMQTVDMVSLLAVGALLLVVALIACWIPARRAAGVDPMKALRAE